MYLISKSIFLLLLMKFSRGFVIKYNNNNKVEDSKFPDVIDVSAFGENAFIDPDNETTGKLVSEYTKDSDQNPEELGMYFEGDILMPFRFFGKNGLISKSTRWPNGIVPYEIAGPYSLKDREAIDWAINEYHKRTCIRFKPRFRENDYISIVNKPSGCWSSVGRIGGKQLVNLQAPQCLYKRGTALHELMHALGFIHEQNRYERDSYIIIRRENIKENMIENFVKSSPKFAHGMGFGYDYTSVMHYSPTSFSKNGKPTIEARKVNQDARLMGQRIGFSVTDVAKINVMYGCKNVDTLEEYELKKDYINGS